MDVKGGLGDFSEGCELLAGSFGKGIEEMEQGNTESVFIMHYCNFALKKCK